MQRKIFSFLFLLGFMLMLSPVFSQTVTTDNPIAKGFLAMLDGTEETAEKAIKQYASKEVIDNGMIPFGKSPKITKVEDDCVYFTLFDDEGEKNEYFICTEGDKITNFNWQE